MLPRICMKKPAVLENDVLGNNDTTAWFTELESHHMGEFSLAAYQANSIMEDYSQVEVGDNSLFVGIYDGHNGPNASKFISNYIFQKLSRLIRENNNVMHDKLLREAMAATEQKFTQVVNDSKKTNPDIMYVGSSCLIALIWKGTLHIANLGDSRAVLGIVDTHRLLMHVVHAEAEELTREHNCADRHNRIALLQHFPDPSLLLKDKNGDKFKGYFKVNATIGDVYIKRSLVYVPKVKNVCLQARQSFISSEPEIGSRILRHGCKFFILASRGFWEIMRNEEAVSIVERHSRRGIAKTLLRKALEKVAEQEKMSYKDIVRCSNRKRFHDDITIIVVFLDNIDKPRNVPKLSYKRPVPYITL